ncbi:WhiB family transcriptional regulator [Calidifontibacter indicus]|uniref:Transcription factor WhiB n=1 Tax=Calidifontibacter indicus TaxID=419650 RepID=A0A3D9UMF6_9MICO|nr:WhiB family transcriptional regulator [Calidifontibacter indicus]REF30638.1 transcription factor WhiB [Calidifontibacter indicus]
MTAAERLDRALLGLAEDGKRPRCAEPGGHELWTSDDPEDRATAVRWCRGCPVLTECADAAAELDATWGVWAGVDRSSNRAGRSQQRPKKTTKKETAA